MKRLKKNIGFFVLQHYYYSSIYLTTLSTCLSPLLDWEPFENKDQITIIFIFSNVQDSAWVMVGKQ